MMMMRISEHVILPMVVVAVVLIMVFLTSIFRVRSIYGNKSQGKYPERNTKRPTTAIAVIISNIENRPLRQLAGKHGWACYANAASTTVTWTFRDMAVVATLDRARTGIPVKLFQRFQLTMHPSFAHFRRHVIFILGPWPIAADMLIWTTRIWGSKIRC